MKHLFQTLVAGLPALPQGQRKATDFSSLTWEAISGQTSSKAGVSVNLDSSLRVSTVLACCRVIAEGVAQLPLEVGIIDETGAFQVQRDEPLHQLLGALPNDWMTSFEWREQMIYNAALGGYGVSYKNQLGRRVGELLPIPINAVQRQRSPRFGMIYRVNDPFGVVGEFTADQLVILRGPSWDGVIPFDVVRLAREAIGLAIATEETAERLHANGARPGGILTMTGQLGPEAKERIKAAAQDFSRGDAFKTMVLDMGATWTPMTMNGVDSQHLEQRRLQIEEICRFFRVFPHMVGYADKTTTFASAESFFQGHVLHTLMPWIIRFEQALFRDITRKNKLVARFEVRELIRGDTGSRATFYASGIVNGWLTRNDARRLEGFSPLQGLDDPLAPLNMTPVGRALDAADPNAAKAIRAAAAAEAKNWMADHKGRMPEDPAQTEDLTDRVADRIFRVLCAMA